MNLRAPILFWLSIILLALTANVFFYSYLDRPRIDMPFPKTPADMRTPPDHAPARSDLFPVQPHDVKG